MSEKQPPSAGPTASPRQDPGVTAAEPRVEATQSQLIAIERCCDEFEDRLRVGEVPDAGAYLSRVAEAVRHQLLRELVRLEQLYRGGPAAEYWRRFPEYAAALDELTRDDPVADTPPSTVPGSTRRDESASGGRFGSYALLARVAAGGMGVVYRARDTRLGREVALKMILGGDRARPEELVRFLAEAQAVAAVDHPHVVRVHEFGEHGGHPFLAMELLTGGTLGRRIEEAAPLDPRAAAELVQKVAAGVAAAHAQGIVHRDLKPSNVLLDSAGEPKVSDFGLAKRGAGLDLTATRAVLGTPAYMAPEQAGGGAKFVGPAADVWALGVILYECLTGKRPFTGGSTDDVLHAVINSNPPSPREVLPAVPRDLDRIVGKCLEKDSRDRYPTAAELVEDLRRFLAGEPISVRPAGRVEKFVKWVRRKPTLAAAYSLTLAVVVLAGLGAGFAALWRGAEDARGSAETARGTAEAARRDADVARSDAVEKGRQLATEKDETAKARDAAVATSNQLAVRNGELAKARDEIDRERKRVAVFEYGRMMQLAHQAWLAGNLLGVLQLLPETPPEHREWEWDYLQRLCHGDLITVTGGQHYSWSPDTGRIAVTRLGGRTVEVRDVGTGRTVVTLAGHAGNVRSVAWSPNGFRIATSAADKTVRVWDAKTGETLATFTGADTSLTPRSWSPDGSRIVTTDTVVGDKTARVWDAKTGKESLVLTGHAGNVLSVAWNPAGSRIATSAADKTVRVWDAKTGETLATFTGSDAGVGRSAWSPDGSRIVTSCGGFTARVWDARTGKEVLPPLGGGTPEVGVPLQRFSLFAAWRPDGERILTWGLLDPSPRVWDARTGRVIATLTGHSDRVSSAAWSPDGSQIATVGLDRTLRTWDGRTGRPLRQGIGHVMSISSVAWSPDGSRIVTIGPRTARVWDSHLDTEFITIPKTDSWYDTIAWSPDGEQLLTTSNRGRNQLWNARTGQLASSIPMKQPDTIRCTAYSPDGRWIVTGEGSGKLRVWDARSREPKVIASPSGHTKAVVRAAFSPDGKRLATGGGDKTVKVWETETWREVITINVDIPIRGRLVFSPDGARVMAGGPDVYDVRTGQRVVTLGARSEQLIVLNQPYENWKIATPGPVGAQCYSPDGSRIVTGGFAGRVWDAGTGDEVLVLQGHVGKVLCAAYSPDGSRIVTGGGDKTVRLWDAKTGAEVFTLRGHTVSVGHASFSPDGKRIVTQGEFGEVRVWDCSPVNRAFLPKELAPPPRERSAPPG